MKIRTIIATVAILGGIMLLATYEFGHIGGDYIIATMGHQSSRSVASYTVIDVMLHRALMQYNVSRIGIARFHVENSQDFYAVFDSMTATPGVSTDISNIQHVPATILDPVLPALMHDRTQLVWTKDLPQGPLRDITVTRKVAVVLYVPIQDQDKHVIGILTAAWLDERELPDATRRDGMANDLATIARNVGRYMSAVPS